MQTNRWADKQGWYGKSLERDNEIETQSKKESNRNIIQERQNVIET